MAQKLQQRKVNKYHMRFPCSHIFPEIENKKSESVKIIFGVAVTTD